MRIVYRIYFAGQDESRNGSSDRFNDKDYSSEAEAESALEEYFQQHPLATFPFIIQKVYVAGRG